MFTAWLMTEIVPALVSAASGALFGALIAGWDKLAARILLAKMGPSITTVYNIVDPILDGTIRGWKDSDVDRAIALVVEIVDDGKLSSTEVNKVVRMVSEKWLPQIATEKVAKGVISEKELAVAEKIREAVETGSLDTPGLAETLKKTYLL